MSQRTLKTGLQQATCSLVAACLVRALGYLSTADSKIRAEAHAWPSGKTLRLEVPGAGGFTVTGTPWGFKKLDKETPGDVTIRFKSPSDAFRVFTGQMGVAQAYAQHKFVLRGDMALAMPFVRCVDITEGYLFPDLLAKRILKRLPEKEVSTARVYGSILLGR